MPSNFMRRYILGEMGGGGLASRINAWQNGGSNVHVGGLPAASFELAIGFGNGTIINRFSAFQQDCTVKQVVISVNARAGGTWKFKVFRWNSGTSKFDMVAEQAFIPAATGSQTIVLNPPISVQIGDCPGVYMPNANEKVALTTTVVGGYIGVRYVSGSDITAPDAFASTSVREINMDCLGNRPYLAVTGDSITAGVSNGTTNWWNIWTTANGNTPATHPGGEPTSEVANQIRARLPNLQYQNQALGGQSWAWGVSAGIPACVALDPKVITVAFGLVDLMTGRTWDQVVADMDSVRVLVPTTIRLIVQQILPASASYASDAQAALIRTWNANYATWCAANNATLALCHDAMGQIRVSTGQLDDLKTAYDIDGRHLTTAGVDALAALYQTYIK